MLISLPPFTFRPVAYVIALTAIPIDIGVPPVTGIIP
jgi:hypothetical protein